MKHKSVICYCISLFLLAILVAVSFIMPRIVSGIQDKVICEKPYYEEQEDIDIASFANSYETSLYKRLARFAQGRADGKACYVTMCGEKTTDEISDFIFSDKGIYSGKMVFLMDVGILPDNLYFSKPEDWKQYVIYGNDYAQGVDLILQYVELKYDAGGINYKLLFDSETGDIYAIRVDNNKVRDIVDTEKARLCQTDDISKMMTIEEIRSNPDFLYGLAGIFCGYYDDKGIEVFEKYGIIYSDSTINEAKVIEEGEAYDESMAEEEIGIHIPEDVDIRAERNQICIGFPFEEHSLTLTLSGKKEVYEIKKEELEIFNIMIGFKEIYELIPEFME